MLETLAITVKSIIMSARDISSYSASQMGSLFEGLSVREVVTHRVSMVYYYIVQLPADTRDNEFNIKVCFGPCIVRTEDEVRK